MKLLLNENINATAVKALRDAGHDVVSIKEASPGAKDPDVLQRAQREKRLIVTHDKDFGELAFRSKLPADCGVILFRLSGESPTVDAQRIVDVIGSRTDWFGQFAVASDDRIRIRKLPSQ